MARSVTAAIAGDPKPGRTPWSEPAAPDTPISAGASSPGADSPAPTAGTSPAPLPAQPQAEPAPAETLRAIAPLEFAEPLEFKPIPTDLPDLDWLAPTELLVSETYQRGLGDKGRALVRRIAEGFDWRKFKPPIVALTNNGFEVLDGQHTALGAALRTDVPKIPVLIVLAANEEERAAAFVSHNTDRVRITPIQIHHARLAARDPEALEAEEVCAEAGMTLVTGFNNQSAWKPGETVAVSTIYRIIRQHGREKATHLFRALIEAEIAPVKEVHLKAMEFLFTDKLYADRLAPLPDGGSHIAEPAKRLGADAIHDATIMGKGEKIPVWRALGMIWFQACKKKLG